MMSVTYRAPANEEERIRWKRDLVAQWAFDTRPLLLRFHLRLEDVEVQWTRGAPSAEFTGDLTFMDGGLERLFAMSGAVTALGTRLFGRFGQGAGLDREGLNRVKKEADAVSAYAMSESLWYLSRQLPENHAILVCLGEGLMAKGGETPEMGSNPQIGFGRVYARPRLARWLDARVMRLLNDPSYDWDDFYDALQRNGVTIWGAAIDTLENTSRFAAGAETGALSVLHLFDQPLEVTRPYEGYFGTLILPDEVVARAAERSVLVDFRTPRGIVLDAIRHTYPDIRPENVHVWTLGGPTRAPRIGKLWEEWRDAGAHVVEDGWCLPNGHAVFTDSGTYSPVFQVGTWEDETGATHLFLVDGYAASAEAVQAATLAETRGLAASMAIFTSKFKLSYDREIGVMNLAPDAPAFEEGLARHLGHSPRAEERERFTAMIREGAEAHLPLERPIVGASDFFPEKHWRTLAVLGYMNPDPYTGAEGVTEVRPGVYRVAVRLAARRGDKLITFTLAMDETMRQSKLVFNPLLVRFIHGEDFRVRPVRISDSGRIRNELQTMCSEALDHLAGGRIRVHFDRIPPEVIALTDQQRLREILEFYKTNHPVWFAWLDLA
jgi:hypothetical protein